MHPVLAAPDVQPVEEVSQDLAAWEGQQVTLGGQVTHSAGPAFALIESFEDAEQRIVLVSDDERPLGVFPGILPARATGTVTAFDRASIEEYLGTTLEEGRYEDFEGMPALLVDGIHFFVNDPQAAGAALVEIVGWPVTLAAVVDEVHSDSVFTLHGGEIVVVAGDAGTQGVAAEQQVEVTGTVTLFNPEEMAGAGLDSEVLDDLEGAPTILAEGIQPLDDVE